MWNKATKTIPCILFALIICYSTSLVAQGSGSESDKTSKKDKKTEENIIKVKWREIPYAKTYLIQIRNAKKQNILDEKTSKPYYILDLKPGSYEKRIGVVNKFGRLERFSGWSEFQIVKVRPPKLPPKEVKSLPNQEILPIAGINTKIEIQGENFVKDTRFSLKKGDRSIKPSKVTIEEDGKAILEFPEGKLPEGNLDLVVENPRNKKVEIPNYTKIHKPVGSEKEKEIAEKQILRKREKAKQRELAQLDPKTEEYRENGKTEKQLVEKDGSHPTDKNEQDPSQPQKTGGIPMAERNRWQPVWRNALAPGWGNFYMEDSRKGYIYSGIFTVGLLFLHNANNQLLNAERNYENTLLQSTLLQLSSGRNLGIQALTINRNEDAFRKYSQKNQEFNLATLLFLGFYFYQLYDVYEDSGIWAKDPKLGWNLGRQDRILTDPTRVQRESYYHTSYTFLLDF